LRIQCDKFAIENEVARERGERFDDLGKRLSSAFSLRENNVTSDLRFTAIER
jgi:hypothetical protein